MLILVVSDLHLGKGEFLKSGQFNLLEDFHEDEKLSEFLDYYSSGKYDSSDVHLVLNGDTFDLLQVDVDGVYSHIVDADYTIKSLEAVMKGHQLVFSALKAFLSKPKKKVTFVYGNHDVGMIFKEAQIYLREQLGQNIDFCETLNLHGVHIEHGHRHDVQNTVVGNVIMDGPNGKKILNLSWGSLFHVMLVPKLKKERPNIDKIRPVRAYIRWCLLNDFRFFWRVSFMILKYFLVSNLSSYIRQNRNFKTTIKLLKQITLFPRLNKRAKVLLDENPSCHTVIMGHGHNYEWRKFPNKRFYFNTGTWNLIPSIDASQMESYSKLIYLTIELHKDTRINNISMKSWQGKWRPYREEVSTLEEFI